MHRSRFQRGTSLAGYEWLEEKMGVLEDKIKDQVWGVVIHETRKREQ